MALHLPIYHPRAVLVDIWAAAQDSLIRLTNVACSQLELCNREKTTTTKTWDRPSRWRENDTKQSGSAPILHLTALLTAMLAGLGLTTNLLLPSKWDLWWLHIILLQLHQHASSCKPLMCAAGQPCWAVCHRVAGEGSLHTCLQTLVLTLRKISVPGEPRRSGSLTVWHPCRAQKSQMICQSSRTVAVDPAASVFVAPSCN